MNLEKLKRAEALFLSRYPGGFDDPAMAEARKKHKMEKMIEKAAAFFSEDAFSRSEELTENLIRFVSASSMISVFEKPKFRDYLRSLNSRDKEELTASLQEMLYFDRREGFDRYLEILRRGKLAKWTLMTVVPAYLRPRDEVFVKPNTAKKAVRLFEMAGPPYRPAPDYEFYAAYRALLLELKSQVSPSLSPSNAAFSGFLMMTMDELEAP